MIYKYVLIEKIWKIPHHPRPATWLIQLADEKTSHVALARQAQTIAQLAIIVGEQTIVRVMSVGYVEIPGYRCWGGCDSLGLRSRGIQDTNVFVSLEKTKGEHWVNEDGDEVENGVT